MADLNLSLKLQPKQSLLLNLCEAGQHTFLGYGGSRGGGKSGAARRVMLLRRLAHPGTSGLIFRRVYDDLKKNHIDKFFEEFPQLFQFYRASDHEVILPSQDGKAPSRIIFAYAETFAEVKRKFHGPEFMDMFIDQAEQLLEEEHQHMRTCCRWPGTREFDCKYVVFFNPGGIGINYFKRIFKDKKFKGREVPTDYEFIQAYGWDNVEWFRSSLIEEGKTEEEFYALSDQERFNAFVQKTEYGRQLDALPAQMRMGHLLGTFDKPAGQYFDVWDPGLHVKKSKDLGIRMWHPKWISIDWGFAHNSAVLWHAQDGPITKTYREFVKSGVGPRALAEKIIELCSLPEEKDEIDAIYISPDASQKRTDEDPISKQIGDVLVAHGFPRPRPADNDRVSGWMLMHEMLQYNRWEISENCEQLIENIPLFTRDDKNPEDCLKFPGDDPGDSARYGLKSRFSPGAIPREIQLQQHMAVVSAQQQTQNIDAGTANTMKHMAHLKFNQEWARKHRPLRKIRNWRVQ